MKGPPIKWDDERLRWLRHAIRLRNQLTNKALAKKFGCTEGAVMAAISRYALLQE